MICQDCFPAEPWCLHETRLDLGLLGQAEALFALSNGHIGLRGNLDEGEPHGTPGSYLNSLYEQRRLPYAEGGYGYPESGEALVNVPNGKLIRILIDDEPFDVRYGELLDHTRRLDLRAGTLERVAEWRSPAGDTVRIRSTRLVSLTHRAVAAIRLDVEAVDRPVRVVLQSELVANEALPPASDDPRVAGDLAAPFLAEDARCSGLEVGLVHSTKLSGLRVASAMDHELACPGTCDTRTEADGDLGRVTVSTRLEPGQSVELTKYLAYGWSAVRSLPALRDQAAAALVAARDTGWDGLLAEQGGYLADFWHHADVVVHGNPILQQAVRFALFQVLQASARAERRPIGAKGLTGTGYDGHCFWDTDTFVLPVLSYTAPDAAADALRWRASTLPAAREHALSLGLAGAAFPWRTITGAECSAYWPAGTAAFHVNADIAAAAIRQAQVTGDVEFEREVGLPLLVETARLWRSLGHHETAEGVGPFRIDGVTGPDEYSAVADNNVYTNLMAQQNLLAAVDVVQRHRDAAEQLDVTENELQAWGRAAEAMTIPWDEELGVHPQSENFTRYAALDFAALRPENYPLMLSMPYVQLYRRQVVKQADLVLAMHLRPDAFTAEQKRRNFEYYEAITVRDSSLSAATQAVLAAEVGHLDLALDYACETALIDLRNLADNTDNGLHLAALAGTWTALVGGFGGLRDHGGELNFAPRLPAALPGLDFAVRYRGARLQVQVRPEKAGYLLLERDRVLRIRHHGEPVDLAPGQELVLPVPAAPALPRPAQPAGRQPAIVHGGEGCEAHNRGMGGTSG
ncbi:MAG: glycoside hydrolase family 65 protein [Sporichthyaceae bacterium]